MDGEIADIGVAAGAVALALSGLGVWSLVVGNMLGTFTAAVATYSINPWLPRFRFRIWALKDVFSFGMWVFINKYLNFFVNNTDFFMIGKLLNERGTSHMVGSASFE